MTAQRVAGVIATWNQEAFIAEAVESLAAEVDEVIVVDDASTDGTAEQLSRLSSPRIHVLSNETSQGVSRSFTRAIEATNAEIILIQGGDDRSLPGRGARQADVLADPRVTLSSSVPYVIDGSGRRLPAGTEAEFLIGPGDGDVLGYLYFTANYLCAPSVAVRKADYLRLGGFPPAIALLQDHALWLRLAAIGSVEVDTEPLIAYRKHGSNTSREYVGLDSPRRRLLSAEREHVLGDFVQTAARSTLERLAGIAGVPLERQDTLRDPELRALIEISHRDKLVVRRGLARAFSIVVAEGGDQRLAAMGLDDSDLASLATIADHDDIGAVTTALGVARQLNPGSNS